MLPSFEWVGVLCVEVAHGGFGLVDGEPETLWIGRLLLFRVITVCMLAEPGFVYIFYLYLPAKKNARLGS